ncbi:MAG: hypothetical protein ACK2T2_04450 [Anaerolineales bacterium]
MSAFTTHSLPKKLLILLLLPLLLFACARTDEVSPPGGEDEDAIPLQNTSEAPSGSVLPDVMGMVMNPDGSPVAFALVGGTELTTFEGMISGAPAASASGWIEVESKGYLTGYTRPYHAFGGTAYVHAYLTPVQFGVLLEQGGVASMDLTPTAGYAVSLDLASSQFPDSPAQVFASPIDPLDVESRHAPNPAGSGSALQMAFGVMAYNDQGEQIPLASGASLAIEVAAPQAGSEDLQLARFDYEAGAWTSEGIQCTSTGAGQFECSSDSLASLFGIFGPSMAAAGSSSGAAVSSADAPRGSVILASLNFDPSMLFRSGQLSSEEDAFKGALGAYHDWLASHGGSLDPDDPQARAVLDALVQSARDSAAVNLNDTGISHLTVAAAAAADAGLGDLSSELEGEAADIADDLGRQDLNESDCGEYKRLLIRAQQILTLKGDANLADQLTQKAQDMATDCDIWIGRIQVFMRVNHSHPAGLDMSSVSGSLWIESHSIQMWTNVDDYVMHGEDKINLIFTQVTYKRDDECKQEIKMYGQGGLQTALIQGRYDGYSFQINSFAPETSGITIVQAWNMQDKVDETCQTILNTQYQFPNYVSVIVHGFEYGSPPITLQDMLDEGSTTSIITPQDSIYGFDEITNPDPDLGKYPFTTARVDWTFTHRDKKLPVKE